MPQTYYRFEANVIGRSRGKQSSRSVVFASAYRAGEKLQFEREGIEADYSTRRGILETGILAPEKAPSWVTDRQTLWNEIETIEKRRDAQLARELLIAFPDQLTPDLQRETLTEFLTSQVVDRGMVADFAIHAPSREGDQRNYHAHVLLTMRSLDDDGFGNKCREWNSPELLTSWREEWANTLNRAFERHGVADADGELYQVDHRSYEKQGIEREPGVHLGPAASAMERRGVATEVGDINREVEERNRERELLRRQAEFLHGEQLKLEAEFQALELTRRRAHQMVLDQQNGIGALSNFMNQSNDNEHELGGGPR
jgi:ATP-dependent exoDNAse (exonuclease V) alpha subunit